VPSLAEVFSGDDYSELDVVRDMLAEAHLEDPLISAWTEGRVYIAEVPAPVNEEGFPQVAWALLRVDDDVKIGGCTTLMATYRQTVAWESYLRALQIGEASIASYFRRSQRVVMALVSQVRETNSFPSIARMVKFESSDFSAVPLESGSVVVFASASVSLEIRVDTYSRQRI